MTQISTNAGFSTGLAVLLSKPVIGRKFDLLVTILPAQSHVCAPGRN